ncbi:MAG: DNA-binding transcriptional regulator [candidate division KSB1 bacterium]|nr:DNA-binding transcriptional regulator [candidate division KSB1 bacterium]
MKRVILLLETSRAFGRELIIGIARYSRMHGPWSFYKEPIDLKSSIPHLTSWKPDGIIMRDSLITDELLKLNISTILAVHDSNYPPKLPVISTDSDSIAKMASSHLIEKGLTNYAFCGFDNYKWSEGRKLHFNKYINKAGFKVFNYRSLRNNTKNDWDIEQEHVADWIRSLPKPVGIFTCNDDRGQHVLEVCKMMKIKVPEEVLVIGVDNDPLVCDIGDPPLTSIALNIQSAGYQAAGLMDEMINSGKIIRKKIIVSPTHVVQRQSSDILAVNDPEVARAIAFIRKNAKNKLFVKDVVKTTCLSRRTLERRFKESIHRTIYSEIRRMRIELIAKMLIETDLPVSQISSIFDFTDLEHISRYFKIEKGLSLREFRKRYQPR